MSAFIYSYILKIPGRFNCKLTHNVKKKTQCESLKFTQQRADSNVDEGLRLQVFEKSAAFMFVKISQFLFVSKFKLVAVREMHVIYKCTLIA